MVRSDDILLFVQVVEQGSFSRVAESLQLTNSVVSKRVARLEAALNAQLLYRTTRKLSLTEAGRLLYNKGKIASSAIQDATNVVSGYSDEIKGTIKLTIPIVSANLVLSKAIAEFCTMYPNVNIDLLVSNQVVDLVDEGFDLAIRTANLEDSTLIARRLVDSRWLVCASPDYIRNYSLPRHPAELTGHECLLFKHDSGGRDTWNFVEDKQTLPISVSGRFFSNNLNAIYNAALSNLGIAFLPQALVHEDIQKATLKPILEKYTNKVMGIYAVYPNCRLPDKKVKLLIEHLRKAFNQRKEYFY